MFVPDRRHPSIPETPVQTHDSNAQCKIIPICRNGGAERQGQRQWEEILHSLKEENENLLLDIEQRLNNDSSES